ncbi:MAG: class I SAM-dependent methyltransferase [Anaerolineae bacterium]|jgi:ubiquinone/menaquinone biosynthesis C-methylase UbiE|nr:methyltransferase domain-containing protein [Chloroflexota bacterium]
MQPLDRINPFADRQVAQAYDAWYDEQLGATVHRLQQELVLQLARPVAGERALDVGTGTGHYAHRLATLGLTVSALDASAEMLAVAQSKPGEIDWRLADAHQLPFPENSFDLVVSVTALEFLKDPAAAIADMLRVLRPGGRLVLGTLNARGPWGEMYREMGRDPASPFFHARLLTSEELVALLAPYGTVTWNSAVFVPPSGRGLALAAAREFLGRLFQRDRGALLVGKVVKR